MRQELLAARSPDTCAYCPSEIPEGTHAWWDSEEHIWACTTCVPTNESQAVGYTAASARERNRQKIAAASFLR
jgi:hypothetical protein